MKGETSNEYILFRNHRIDVHCSALDICEFTYGVRKIVEIEGFGELTPKLVKL